MQLTAAYVNTICTLSFQIFHLFCNVAIPITTQLQTIATSTVHGLPSSGALRADLPPVGLHEPVQGSGLARKLIKTFVTERPEIFRRITCTGLHKTFISTSRGSSTLGRLLRHPVSSERYQYQT